MITMKLNVGFKLREERLIGPYHKYMKRSRYGTPENKAKRSAERTSLILEFEHCRSKLSSYLLELTTNINRNCRHTRNGNTA